MLLFLFHFFIFNPAYFTYKKKFAQKKKKNFIKKNKQKSVVKAISYMNERI